MTRRHALVSMMLTSGVSLGSLAAEPVIVIESQGFSARLGDREVIIVTDRTVGPSWDWGLSLLRHGRAGQLVEAGPAAPWVRGERVERVRPGIEEWFIDDERGLEHGFTLHTAPRPVRGEGEVLIEMALSGALRPRFSADGLAVDFWTPEGAYALRYGGLLVVDASGRTLPARMEGFSQQGTRGIRIRFDDSGARYPVTVDPMVATAAWTVESDQASAHMGSALSTAGDVNGDGYSDVIASAPYYSNGNTQEGRVTVFLGSASGLGTSAAWTVEGEQNFAWMGTTVATAGDVNGDGFDDVLVGAYQRDNGQTDEGQVFLYLGSASGLSTTPAWTVEGNVAFAYFGGSIAGAGDVNGDGFADVIVGDTVYSNGQQNEGRALVYLGSSSGLAASPSWTVEGNQVEAQLGVSVASAGDINGDGFADVIVGAYQFSNGQSQEGAAFVYHGSVSGLATTAASVLDNDVSFSQFGASVAGAGDVNGDGYADVIVGAPTYDGGDTGEGAAFLFHGSATGVLTSPQWFVQGNQSPTFGEGTNLGGCVATAGDVDGDGYADVIVGARNYDSLFQDEGAALLYLGGPFGVSATHHLRLLGNQVGAAFGAQVGTAGDVDGDGYSDVLASAIRFDNGQSDEGRAYLYSGAARVPPTAWASLASGSHDGSYYGKSVSFAGDVNGDGYSDVIVGAPWHDDGAQLDAGRAAVVLGSPTGLAPAPAWSVVGEHSGALVGHWVAGAGDVNGDGYSDVIVGAPGFANGQSQEGKASVYLGSPSGIAASAAWTVEGDLVDGKFGGSVASAGDVNGDGFSDVLVGTGGSGRAYLFLGSPSGPSISPAWVDQGLSGYEDEAVGVASAGDVNGDGYSDIIIGSPGYSNGESLEGRAYVRLGSPAGVSGAISWSFEPDSVQTLAGVAVSTAGDVNGDGYSDVVVGGMGWSISGLTREGRAWVFLGSAVGVQAAPAWTAIGSGVGAFFGQAVAAAGDVDGDGYGDVLVAEPGYSEGFGGYGRAHLFLGSASGPGPIAWSALIGGQTPFSQTGRSVAGSGDVNADGFSDLVVGVPGYYDQVSARGAAFLYLGGGGDGIERMPRQHRIDGAVPIALLGRSDDATGVRLTGRGISAAGRSKLRWEWEVKPLGSAFDGTGTDSTAMADTGVPGPAGSAALYSEVVSGLTEGSPYHWRVRVVGDDPRFPRSPWISMPGNSVTETKLRTSGCVDADGDGYGALPDPSCTLSAVDCSDGDATAWALPGETTGMLFSDKSNLSWSAPVNPGGSAALTFAVVRLDTAAGSGAVCLSDPNDSDTTITLTSDPSPDAGHYFLSRAKNACGAGTWGQQSSGAERIYPVVCP